MVGENFIDMLPLESRRGNADPILIVHAVFILFGRAADGFEYGAAHEEPRLNNPNLVMEALQQRFRLWVYIAFPEELSAVVDKVDLAVDHIDTGILLERACDEIKHLVGRVKIV